MNKAQQKRFNSLYQKHVSALTRQGKAATTIDLYSPVLFKIVRRISSFFDCPHDPLRQEQFEAYFESLIQTHSWSRVKVDRNELQLFYKYGLKQEWNWVEIVRPPLKAVVHDWAMLYGLEPWLAETWVDGSRFTGGCYRAANWKDIGEATGRGRQDKAHRHD